MVVAQLVEQLLPKQTSVVQIHSSANVIYYQLYSKLYLKDENKEKEARKVPFKHNLIIKAKGWNVAAMKSPEIGGWMVVDCRQHYSRADRLKTFFNAFAIMIFISARYLNLKTGADVINKF